MEHKTREIKLYYLKRAVYLREMESGGETL